jgi:hypothetical protein
MRPVAGNGQTGSWKACSDRGECQKRDIKSLLRRQTAETQKARLIESQRFWWERWELQAVMDDRAPVADLWCQLPSLLQHGRRTTGHPIGGTQGVGHDRVKLISPLAVQRYEERRRMGMAGREVKEVGRPYSVDVDQVRGEALLERDNTLADLPDAIDAAGSDGTLKRDVMDQNTFVPRLFWPVSMPLRRHHNEFVASIPQARQQLGRKNFNASDVRPERPGPKEDAHRTLTRR